MDLRDYLAILRARWLVVLLVPLLAVTGAAVYSFRATPTYVARTSVFFSVTVGETASELSRGFPYAQSLVRTYSGIATQPVVLGPVIQRLGLDLTPEQLAAKVTAQSPLDTVLVQISVSDASPEQAAGIANAIGQQLIVAVRELAPQAGSRSLVQVTTAAPAAVPTEPSSPRTKLNIALALALGLLAGIVLALVLQALGGRVEGRRGVARVTRTPVLGTVTLRRGVSDIGDDARRLRTNVQHLRAAGDLRSLVVTSVVEDGATGQVVSQLAVGFAQAGYRPLVVDADLRRPSLAARFGGDDGQGLSSVINGEQDWRTAVRPGTSTPSVPVLPAGPALEDPSAMLDAGHLTKVIDEMTAEYDLVLVLAPPVLRVAEGLLLARLCDGVVIVSRRSGQRSVRRDALAEQVEALDESGAHLLGVVLTA